MSPAHQDLRSELETAFDRTFVLGAEKLTMNRKISEMKAFTRVQWLSNYYPELGVAGLGIISIVHIILIWLLKNQSSPGHALSEVNELLPECEFAVICRIIC